MLLFNKKQEFIVLRQYFTYRITNKHNIFYWIIKKNLAPLLWMHYDNINYL